MKLAKLLVLTMLSTFAALAADPVHNGETPKKKHTIVFTEDLRFGQEDGGDEFLWTASTTSVVANDAGHMFVADPSGQRIIEFDPEGKLVKVVAKKGSGPGELQGLSHATILKDGRLVSFEVLNFAFPRIGFFDAEGKFLEWSQPQGTGLLAQSAVFSPNAEQFFTTYIDLNMNEQKMFINSALVKTDGFKIVKNYSTGERPMFNQARAQDPDYWAEFIGGNLKTFYDGFFIGVFDPQGNVYVCDGSKYEVEKYTPDLSQQILHFDRKFKPIANNEEELEGMAEIAADQFRGSGISFINKAVMMKALKISEPPPRKFPIFGLIPWENKGLLVIHDVRMSDGVQRADIFNKDGEYLGYTELDNHAFLKPAGMAFTPNMVFRNGFAYTVEIDEDGENEVVRYKYELKEI